MFDERTRGIRRLEGVVERVTKPEGEVVKLVLYDVTRPEARRRKIELEKPPEKAEIPRRPRVEPLFMAPTDLMQDIIGDVKATKMEWIYFATTPEEIRVRGTDEEEYRAYAALDTIPRIEKPSDYVVTIRDHYDDLLRVLRGAPAPTIVTIAKAIDTKGPFKDQTFAIAYDLKVGSAWYVLDDSTADPVKTSLGASYVRPIEAAKEELRVIPVPPPPPVPPPAPPPPVAPPPPKMKLVRFLESVPAYVGVDGEEYGPFERGEVANIPEEDAARFIEEGVAEEVPVVPLPEEVEAWAAALSLNVVGDPRQETPPGFRRPVWIAPVRNEETGEVFEAIIGYPITRRELYRLVPITNKRDRTATILVKREEAIAKFETPEPPAEEVQRAIETAQQKVPEEVITAPLDWKWYGSLVERMDKWLQAAHTQAARQRPLGVYTYLQSMKENLEKIKEKIVEAKPETFTFYEKPRPPPAVKVLADHEYEALWNLFSEILRREGVDAKVYRDRFDAVITWELPYKDNEFMVKEEARYIISETLFERTTPRVYLEPGKFSWKYVTWGLASLT
ncbi:MAG: hypothetical protein ACE5Z5_14960, partial [Candidatus Bathyarchaeia archaeon]